MKTHNERIKTFCKSILKKGSIKYVNNIIIDKGEQYNFTLVEKSPYSKENILDSILVCNELIYGFLVLDDTLIVYTKVAR